MRTHSLHPLATAGEGLLAAEVKDQAEQRRLAPLERRRVRLWFKLGIQLHRGHKSFSPFSHWPPPAPASPQSRRCGAPSGEKQAVIQRNTAHLPGSEPLDADGEEEQEGVGAEECSWRRPHPASEQL